MRTGLQVENERGFGRGSLPPSAPGLLAQTPQAPNPRPCFCRTSLDSLASSNGIPNPRTDHNRSSCSSCTFGHGSGTPGGTRQRISVPDFPRGGQSSWLLVIISHKYPETVPDCFIYIPSRGKKQRQRQNQTGENGAICKALLRMSGLFCLLLSREERNYNKLLAGEPRRRRGRQAEARGRGAHSCAESSLVTPEQPAGRTEHPQPQFSC